MWFIKRRTLADSTTAASAAWSPFLRARSSAGVARLFDLFVVPLIHEVQDGADNLDRVAVIGVRVQLPVMNRAKPST